MKDEVRGKGVTGVGEKSLFQAEGKASAKAQRQERDCKVGRSITKVRSVVNNEGRGVS